MPPADPNREAGVKFNAYVEATVKVSQGLTTGGPEKCPHCGALYGKEATFCKRCGTQRGKGASFNPCFDDQKNPGSCTKKDCIYRHVGSASEPNCITQLAGGPPAPPGGGLPGKTGRKQKGAKGHGKGAIAAPAGVDEGKGASQEEKGTPQKEEAKGDVSCAEHAK